MNKNLINGCSEQQVTFRKSLRLFCRWEDNIKMHLKEICREGVVPASQTQVSYYKDEVTGEWRRLHNKELNAVYL